MTFRKYDKIHRLGKEETEGILEGLCYIQEKIDGANTSIWLDEGTIKCASRNREIEDGFNGFIDYIYDSPSGAAIQQTLKDNPEFILYGEWLVPHTNTYNKESYKHWYLFDIYDKGIEEYETPISVKYLANSYGILTPWHIDTIENPTIEQLKELVGKSNLGDKGEGIVIKNPNFKNKFGNRVCAKLVRDAFMEENALVFGGNNKQAENYQELYFVQKYVTEARLLKIINKLQPEINERLDLKHIPRITHTVYHDMISEEAWEIAKQNKIIDFKQLQRLVFNRAKVLYKEYIEKGP